MTVYHGPTVRSRDAEKLATAREKAHEIRKSLDPNDFMDRALIRLVSNTDRLLDAVEHLPTRWYGRPKYRSKKSDVEILRAIVLEDIRLFCSGGSPFEMNLPDAINTYATTARMEAYTALQEKK